MKIKRTLQILLCVTLLSCAGFGEERDAASYAKECSVERDDFKKTVHFFSPLLRNKVGFDRLEIQQGTRAGTAPQYFVKFETHRSMEDGWAVWATLSDEHGKEFKLEQLDSTITPEGRLIETYTAHVTREYFDSVKATGVKWRIYGHGGITEDWEAPAAFIQGVLLRCDAGK